ncbi:MAG TPA: BF3164 family lipoprotein [Longimicrobium sp.]|nr:BF3164 family lipoprotein [Longimicrobium sp.]
MYSTKWLAAVAVAAAACACGEQTEDTQRTPGAVPVGRAEAVQGTGSFRGRVPRLAATAQPEDTLRLNRLFGDSVAFASISGIQPLGRHLFVTDRLMSKHLALIDLRTGAVKGRAGKHGEGPNEFRDPGAFMVQSVSPPRSWVYDFQNRRLSLLAASEDGALEIEQSRPFNVGESIEQPLRIGERYVANGLFPDFTLLVLDSTAQPVQRIEADPPFPARTMPHVVGRRLLNRSYLTAHPGGERLALAYQWASRLDFFSADGSRLGSVHGPRPTAAKYSVSGENRFFWDPEGQMAYTGIQATGRYVYAAFCGCRETDDRDQRSQRVHVFRWNGDFVSEIQLDRRMTAFAVSPDDAFLYGSVTEPHPAVAEWKLPAALQGAAGN